MKQLKIAINCQLIPGGGTGGVEQFVIGLVHGLGELKDGNEKYLLIKDPRAPDWLKPYMGNNQTIVTHPWSGWVEMITVSIKSMARQFQHIPLIWESLRGIYSYFRKNTKGPPQSDGFWESLGVDVVHFPYQSMELSEVPSIFNPHDLQHLHYPEFFMSTTLTWREANYPVCCRHAQVVVAESQWTKNDLISQYAIDSQKIYVIPQGAPTEVYASVSSEVLATVRRKYNLPEQFAFYPAQTWPHKNHIALLKALALLRDQHELTIFLVCTGRKNDFWPTISKCIQNLNLKNQVRFLGFVSPTELRALYRLAQFVIFPSLFEGGGFPVLEAFRESTPIACSEVTSLPEQAGDAALLFDPTSIENIAAALQRMAIDNELRESLRRRGAERIKLFNWERTARMYRALYRKVAGQTLTEEDQVLLKEALIPYKFLRNDWNIYRGNKFKHR